MKKRMVFNPAWNPRLKVWVHQRIEKISKKENFCSTCESHERCPILHGLAEIKNSNKVDFIITRCGFYRSTFYDSSNKLQNQLKQETHYNNPDVWVNPSSEELRKTQCMCRTESCRKLNIKNSEKNCSIANQLFKICKEYDIALLLFQCPNWNNTKRKLKSYLISL
jgi:hypothetical protein